MIVKGPYIALYLRPARWQFEVFGIFKVVRFRGHFYAQAKRFQLAERIESLARTGIGRGQPGASSIQEG